MYFDCNYGEDTGNLQIFMSNLQESYWYFTCNLQVNCIYFTHTPVIYPWLQVKYPSSYCKYPIFTCRLHVSYP